MNRMEILLLMMLGLLPVAVGGCARPDDLEKAEILLSRGDYQEAILLCDTFLGQDPRDVEWLTKKGRTYIEMKEYALAEETLLRAVECEPSNSEPHYELERLYLRANNSDKARYHGDLAARLDPKNILRLPETPRVETAGSVVRAGSQESVTGPDISSWSQDREKVDSESAGSASVLNRRGTIGRESDRGSAEVPRASRSTDPTSFSHRRPTKSQENSKESLYPADRFKAGENEIVKPESTASRRRPGIERNPKIGPVPSPSYVPPPRRFYDSDQPQVTNVPGWQNGAFSLSAPPSATGPQSDPGGVRPYSAGSSRTAWQQWDAGNDGRRSPSLTSSPTPSLLSFKNLGADPLRPLGAPPGSQPSMAVPRPGPLRSGVRTQMGPLPTAPNGNPWGFGAGASFSTSNATGR